jgi:hypothetical protein
MEKSIQWFNLVPEQEQFCREALMELTTILAANYPNLPRVELKRVSADEEAEIAQLRDYGQLTRYDKIFGFCKGTEDFVLGIKAKAPHAFWGAAQINAYALAWKPNNKYLIWHEFIHLLLVNDCYDENDPDFKTTCGELHCIMQYVPNEEHCGGGLVLCKKVYDQINQYRLA